jgi:hypothetical protein
MTRPARCRPGAGQHGRTARPAKLLAALAAAALLVFSRARLAG